VEFVLNGSNGLRELQIENCKMQIANYLPADLQFSLPILQFAIPISITSSSPDKPAVAAKTMVSASAPP
jgi:hypothetical protein